MYICTHRIVCFSCYAQLILIKTVQLTMSVSSNVFVTSVQHLIWVLKCVPVRMVLHWTQTWEIAQVSTWDTCSSNQKWWNCRLLSHTDVDECNGSNPCSQNCTNTIGSFVCGCTSGYRLGNDNFNCEGKNITSWTHWSFYTMTMHMHYVHYYCTSVAQHPDWRFPFFIWHFAALNNNKIVCCAINLLS